MIAILDYGAGNLRSVAKALERLGYEAEVTHEPERVLEANAVILPGVGAAADAMRNLRELGMVETIGKVVVQGKPFLGVCLGLQLLFDASEEGGGHLCLGLMPGVVRRLPGGLKVPHMGWNQVHQRLHHPLFADIPDGAHFYFVHSYYAEPEDGSIVAAETEYGLPFSSVVIQGNLMGTQFHPEKSGELGLLLYHNFCRLAEGKG